VAASFQVLAARRHVLLGTHDLRASAKAIGSLSHRQDPATRETVRADLVSAQREFASARSDLQLWSPVLNHLGWVPMVGGQLASASAATEASLYASSAMLHLFDGLAPVWPAVVGHASGTPLSVRIVAPLQAGHGEFLSAFRDVDRASQALDRLPRNSGNTRFDGAAAQLRENLPTLRVASMWLAAAPMILGAQTPGRYLLVLQDPAELRATGGFIGAAGFVRIYQGSLTTAFTGSALWHEIASVVTPLPEALYTPEAYWTFRDSNWSPHFPLSARLERWFYGEDTGHWADGVINFVDTAAPDILAAVGPVYLPPYHRWVNAGNVAAVAQQYVNGLFKGPSQQGSADTVRKQFFGWVMIASLRRLQTLPLHRWPALGAALARAIARRDIVVYDRRAAVQSVIRASGADGSMVHSAGDFLYVVDDNRSYNKVNPYVHEWAAYNVKIAPNLSLDVTLRVYYHVAPSPRDLEGFGPGSGLWGTKHDYQDFLRVYAPHGAKLQHMSGLQPWAPAPAYGLTQFAGRVLVRSGQTATVTIKYSIPANIFSARDFRRYSLTVQRQPGTNLSSLKVSIRGAGDITLGPRRARSFDRSLGLDRDAHLRLEIHGASEPLIVRLPYRHGPADPYVPFGYIRDPRHPL